MQPSRQNSKTLLILEGNLLTMVLVLVHRQKSKPRTNPRMDILRQKDTETLVNMELVLPTPLLKGVVEKQILENPLMTNQEIFGILIMIPRVMQQYHLQNIEAGMLIHREHNLLWIMLEVQL